MNDRMFVIIQKWTKADSIRLHAGEISPAAMRTVLAITQAMGREVQEEHDKQIDQLFDESLKSL